MIDAQAYVLRETGVIPVLEDIQISDELTAGQVRLKVLYSGLCATQMEEIFVSSRNAKYMPHLFGHEGVGVVEAVGPGVVTKQIGDICVIHWRQSSVGLDANPGSYFVGGKKINSGKVVTFSTQVVVPENRVSAIGAIPDLRTAALLGCALPTGWGAVTKTSRVTTADKVVVIGLGGVGLSALEALIGQGVSQIRIVDPLRDLPRELRMPGHKRYPRIEDLVSHETPPEIAIDTSGSSEVLEKLVDWMPAGSKVVLVGMPRFGTKARIDTQKLLDGMTLVGCNGGEVDHGSDINALMEALASTDFAGEGLQLFEANRFGLPEAIAKHQSGLFRRAVLRFFETAG